MVFSCGIIASLSEGLLAFAEHKSENPIRVFICYTVSINYGHKISQDQAAEVSFK